MKKKNKMKTMITLLLALALLLSSAGAVLAASQTGKCGENLTWTLSEDGTLTVSGNGPMQSYVNYPWKDSGEIRAVVIEAGVTSVAKMAFQENISLREACLRLGVLTAEEFDRVFVPENMV